jgi:paraquat-inducible protein A
VLYCVAVTAPFLTVDIVGQVRRTTMLSLPSAMIQHGAWELGVVVLLTAIVMPACKIGVLLFVLVGLRSPNPPASLPFVFKWYRRIGPWAMVEVFLLGVFVAFTRLGSIATVDTGVALYAVAALMVTMVTADYLLDHEALWEIMESHGLVPPAERGDGSGIACDGCRRVNYAPEGSLCSRCGARLHGRKPNSIGNTWALLAAAALLYIPANVYPVMTVVRLGSGTPSTILGGAQELLEAGMWPLALLVFVASITVPLFKLVSLALMMLAIHRRSAWRLHDRTRIFRVVDFIGRWSMIDVFMLSTLVSLVQAGFIADIQPGIGAICFGSVVVLTMFAAACFDPRLMWDAAGAGEFDAEFASTPMLDTPAPATTGHA